MTKADIVKQGKVASYGFLIYLALVLCIPLIDFLMKIM